MDVYEIITERVLAQIETGTVPWRKPWASGGIPKNLVSRKEYSGINPFLLNCASWSNPYWLTFKQAKDLGGTVRKGEKSSIVVFWKLQEAMERDTETGEETQKTIPVLRYYNVFNAEQCDGIKTPWEAVRKNHRPIEECERLIATMPEKPEIKTASRAFYRPSDDTVNVPEIGLFDSPEEFYSVLFHELGHSTGHEKRLNRKGITDAILFGSHEYSKEELVAEFTASYLAGITGIERRTLDNSAAYLRGWMKALNNNKNWLVWAAAQAQKAADFIQGKHVQPIKEAA